MEPTYSTLVEPIISSLEKLKESGITYDQVKNEIRKIKDLLENKDYFVDSAESAAEGLETLLLSLSPVPSKEEEIIDELDNCIDYLREIGY